MDRLRPRSMQGGVPDVDWGEVPTAQDLYGRYDRDVAAATVEALQRVSEHEPAITSAVVDAIPEDCRPDGLEFRMKSPSSLARKIALKAEQRPDLGAHDISATLTDFVRYTVVAPSADRLVASATEVMDKLRSAGWSEVGAEQMYIEGNPYKGLHVISHHRESGQDVEIQFHTEQEIAIKNTFHAQYEIERDTSRTRSSRAEAREEMVEAWAAVDQPPGLEGLEIGAVPVKPKAYPNRYKMK